MYAYHETFMQHQVQRDLINLFDIPHENNVMFRDTDIHPDNTNSHANY